MLKQKLVSLLVRLLRTPPVRSEVHAIFRDFITAPENQSALWKAAQVRPNNADCHWSAVPNNIDEERFRIATRQAADFIHNEMPQAPGLSDPFALLSHCLDLAPKTGLVLEFGVYSGTTINHIARQVDRPVHGFDSFQGLPEQWGRLPKGHFSTQGTMPKVADNVRLHAGWFEDTIPPFVNDHPEQVAFLHIDSDLYSSARTILHGLQEKIVAGTVIVFDEYLNYPYWKEHEHRAFQEFVKAFNISFEYLAYSVRGFSVGVKIVT